MRRQMAVNSTFVLPFMLLNGLAFCLLGILAVVSFSCTQEGFQSNLPDRLSRVVNAAQLLLYGALALMILNSIFIFIVCAYGGRVFETAPENDVLVEEGLAVHEDNERASARRTQNEETISTFAEERIDETEVVTEF